MKKKRILICLLIFLIACGLGVAGYLYFFTPKIVFVSEPALVEINETFDPMDQIKDVKHGDVKDVTIKEQNVDTHQLGDYQVIYQLDQTKYKLMVQVVDRKAPVVTTQDITMSVDDDFDPEDAIKEIKDETDTTVQLKEETTFDKAETKTVTLVITDQGDNKTEATIKVHVLEKDTQPPVIQAEDVVLQLNDTFDAEATAKASDERDGEVKVSVEENDVDTSTPGTYTVKYSATDKHGNVAEKTIKVTVKKSETTGDKVIYLTIDDGPSANTPAILDILDRYHVKATFFVTAQSPNYLNYIKLAYQKGHAIGLHTYSHDYASLYASDSAYFEDLQAISDVVYQQTGIRSDIIRFPGGSSNTISANYSNGIMSRLSQAVRAKGYQYFDWNSSSGDGNSAIGSASLIQEATSFGGQSPLMMLTHDHAGSYSSVEALPSIIEYYQNLGYTFQTVNSSTDGYHHGINN